MVIKSSSTTYIADIFHYSVDVVTFKKFIVHSYSYSYSFIFSPPSRLNIPSKQITLVTLITQNIKKKTYLFHNNVFVALIRHFYNKTIISTIYSSIVKEPTCIKGPLQSSSQEIKKTPPAPFEGEREGGGRESVDNLP